MDAKTEIKALLCAHCLLFSLTASEYRPLNQNDEFPRTPLN